MQYKFNYGMSIIVAAISPTIQVDARHDAGSKIKPYLVMRIRNDQIIRRPLLV